MNKKSMYEEEILKEIEKIKKAEIVCVVEGKKDKTALGKLGITNIKILNKPLYEIVEELIGEESIAILTDLDDKGKQLYSKISKDLQKCGVKIDNTLRKLLLRAHVSHIEGLATYLSKKTKNTTSFS